MPLELSPQALVIILKPPVGRALGRGSRARDARDAGDARDRGHPEQFRYRTRLSPSLACINGQRSAKINNSVQFTASFAILTIFLTSDLSYNIKPSHIISRPAQNTTLSNYPPPNTLSTLSPQTHHLKPLSKSPRPPPLRLHTHHTTLPPMSSSAASGLLSRQLKQMQSDKGVPGISCGLVSDNIFEWEVMLMISDDCKYYGGTYTVPKISPTNHSTLFSTIIIIDS